MPDKLISDLELAGIRTDAIEQLFPDAGRVVRLDRASQTINRTTAQIEGTVESTIYNGEAAIYPVRARRDRFDEFGGGLIFTRQYRIVLPYTATGIQLGDDWITDDSDDPDLIGRRMEVRDVLVSTIMGYRSLTVQDSEQ